MVLHLEKTGFVKVVPDERRDPSTRGHLQDLESPEMWEKKEESQTDKFETKNFTELTHDVCLDLDVQGWPPLLPPLSFVILSEGVNSGPEWGR